MTRSATIRTIPLLLASAACLASGAGCGARAGTGEVVVEGGPVEGDPAALADDCEDRRVILPGLLDLVDHPDSAVRLRLATALGRIGDAEGLDTLSRLAGDRDPQVAATAVFSIGLLGRDAAGALPLLRELVAGADGPLVPAALGALGRAGAEEDAALLSAAASASGDTVRAGAALRALGNMGQREVAVGEEAVSKIAGRLGDEAEEVRFLAAFALYRVRGGSPEGVVESLRAAAGGDPSARVRAYSVRALARRGGLDVAAFGDALADGDPAVVATAVGATDLVEGEGRCALVAVAVDHFAALLSESEDALLDGRVHAIRAALEAASRCPAAASPSSMAAILAATERADAGPRTGGVAQVRCLGRLLAGSGDLSLVACDPSRPHLGKRMLVRRLGRGSETSGPDVAVLIQMMDDPDPRAASAAVAALCGVPTAAARDAVLRAISEGRAIVSAAAMDGVASAPDEFVSVDADGARRAAPGVLERIGEAVDRFGPVSGLTAPLLSAAVAVGAIGDPAGSRVLDRLIADPRPEIRWATLDAYDALAGADPPARIPATAPSRPVPSATKAAWRGRTATARVRTSRGSMTIRLLPDVAPATVESFVSLAREGYFDGTEIHRVVPGFVVQAGDPSGTGLGDPGYNLRCEVSPTRYERGVVGMALSGKDTGGSQFFVTLSEQPHLDGGYTAFGRVSQGMDVADILEEGDAILEIQVEVQADGAP
jgi:cyclophilin family peptidyl-prolyl cis-trans isomerase/HEAT repeat protein